MAVKQFDIIKRSYFTGSELIPIDDLYSPIGLRVEGGGYIFYDDTVGFPSSKISVDKNALATRWGVEASYGDYYYDMLRGCVVRESAGTCNRFMVVDETDMVSSACGSMLVWDTESGASTSRATSTDFGYGSANTKLLGGSAPHMSDSLISDSTAIWLTAAYFRYRNPQGASGSDISNSATDTRWFVPSKDELYVLSCMAFYNDSSRPSDSIYSHQLQIPFWENYWSSSQWSSSQHSNPVKYAWICGFGGLSQSGLLKSADDSARVRLCRTF